MGASLQSRSAREKPLVLLFGMFAAFAVCLAMAGVYARRGTPGRQASLSGSGTPAGSRGARGRLSSGAPGVRARSGAGAEDGVREIGRFVGSPGWTANSGLLLLDPLRTDCRAAVGVPFDLPRDKGSSDFASIDDGVVLPRPRCGTFSGPARAPRRRGTAGRVENYIEPADRGDATPQQRGGPGASRHFFGLSLLATTKLPICRPMSTPLRPVTW